jgi:predicted deacylase
MPGHRCSSAPDRLSTLARLGLGAAVLLAFCGPAAAQVVPSRTLEASRPGPTVTFVAGIHGGKRAAVLALEELAPVLGARLERGRVIFVAPANLAGYRAGLAQLSPEDGLNLNRVFPGDSAGRPTERIAAYFMAHVVPPTDLLVDLHGSDGDEAVWRFAYAARPGVDPAVDSAALDLARRWGTPVVVWDEDGPRTLAESRFLQTAAHLSGVPAITVFEHGNTRDDPAATARFKAGVLRVLASLEMLRDTVAPAPAPELLTRREVALAPRPGGWQPIRAPGDLVKPGELLGHLTGSSWGRTPVRAAVPGRILHQRNPGDVPRGAPLVILGVAAASPH